MPSEIPPATPATSSRPGRLAKAGAHPSLLQRCCCCLLPGASMRFKQFDDEGPSAEFRQRMERAQSALDMNEKRKSVLPSTLAASKPSRAGRRTSRTTTTPRATFWSMDSKSGARARV